MSHVVYYTPVLSMTREGGAIVRKEKKLRWRPLRSGWRIYCWFSTVTDSSPDTPNKRI